jgi:hypothetical protein
MKESTKTRNERIVEEAVFAHYMDTGKWCNAKEIAERCKRSVGWVRNVITETHGCPRGCTVTKGYGRTYEYAPSRDYMRDVITGLRSMYTDAQECAGVR